MGFTSGVNVKVVHFQQNEIKKNYPLLGKFIGDMRALRNCIALSTCARKSLLASQPVRHGGTWVYRTLAKPKSANHVKKAEFVGALAWWWVLWHLWTEPSHLVGHFEYPDPSKWTDAELGIPPDDLDRK